MGVCNTILQVVEGNRSGTDKSISKAAGMLPMPYLQTIILMTVMYVDIFDHFCVFNLLPTALCVHPHSDWGTQHYIQLHWAGDYRIIAFIVYGINH